MSFLVVKLDEKSRILDGFEFETHGLATQKAHELSDEGFRSAVVPSEMNPDVLEWLRVIREKKEIGFDTTHGVIPNGARERGEGARTVGRMIYPAFGGTIQEEQEGRDIMEKSEIPEYPKVVNSLPRPKFVMKSYSPLEKLERLGLAQSDAPRPALASKEHLDSVKEEPEGADRTRASLTSSSKENETIPQKSGRKFVVKKHG